MAEMWRTVDDPNVDDATKEREWNKMRTYARKDTELLDPLYDALLPWLKVPHPLTGDDAGITCHACGSLNLQRRGYALTQVGRYQKFRCNDCGAWFRGAKRESVSEIRAI